MSARRASAVAAAGERDLMRIGTGAALGASAVVIAGVAAWPIYGSGAFVLLVVVGSLLAAGIAVVAHLRRWSGWLVAGVLALVVLLLGVPLAVPSRLGPPDQLLRGLGELASGLVLGWKDLVTVEPPVGSYRNLLVPALVVFLIGTCALLLLAWRPDRLGYATVPVALGMAAFGLFFGRDAVSDPLRLGPVVLYSPWETALGAAALVTSLLWLAARAHDERLRALQRAAASSGVRVSQRPSRADRRRTALGATMLVAALVAAVAVVPFLARDADRDVLRSAIDPDIDMSAEPSPLSGYRGFFADGAVERTMFTVSAADAALPARVRIATLDSYDGEVYRSGGDGTVEAGRFVRVPSTLDAGEGTTVSAQVVVDGWGEVWMPTVGQVQSVDFTGERAASLADRFYYNAEAAGGVQTAAGGLRSGDAYVVRGIEAETTPLAELTPPGGTGGGVAAPDSLVAWMDAHTTGSGGVALEGLVTLLRERGFLSHGLDGGTEEDPAEWTALLADYTFQPSASGHSLARIQTMFERLLERESDLRAESTGNYVAAVGDDEQFAVAVSLIARELGFPARVVLGARLTTADSGLETCDGGVCTASDLAVWTEVQSVDGAWTAIDVTPQHAVAPSLEVTRQRDPENVTEVRPDTVEEVVPPDPAQLDSAIDRADDDEAGPDLSWLGPAARIAGIAILLLILAFGPFLLVIGAKAARRRGRRRAETPALRVAGGWDEYLDAAVDAGRDAPRVATRSELAAAFATPSAADLAVGADRAVFSDAEIDAEIAGEYWRSVDEERRRLRRERGFWRGLAATVSLRSLLRPLAPETGISTRFAERGRRRAEPARPTS